MKTKVLAFGCGFALAGALAVLAWDLYWIWQEDNQ